MIVQEQYYFGKLKQNDFAVEHQEMSGLLGDWMMKSIVLLCYGYSLIVLPVKYFLLL